MNGKNYKIIVAVTGASGSIYARIAIDQLLAMPSDGEVAIIFTDNGRKVCEFEGQMPILDNPRIRVCDNGDMFDPAASGSAGYDAMIVIPCSMGTAGRIASGTSSDLVGRAADVMLKEKRPLVLAVREAPLNLIHLRNLTALAQAGATILPAAPYFYGHPSTIEELCLTVVHRCIAAAGLGYNGMRWTGGE